jgi:phosphoribosylanthranilate isomerase
MACARVALPERIIVSAVPVRIKICGLTRVDDARDCLAAGADWIGLNFHPASKRFIDPDAALRIVEAIAQPARVVGLFVNRRPEEVEEIADRLGLTTIQLHGDEPPEDFVRLDRFWIIRAFRLGNCADVEAMKRCLARAEVLGRLPDAVLVDGSAPGLAGGTGQLVSEDLLRSLPPMPRLILAGGLTPQNVAARLALVQPWMVDVASGVESAPGRKELAKVAAFISAARSASL